MDSTIAKEMKLKFQPVALLRSDDRPGDVMQFSEGKWGCVMWLVASAAKGKTAACDRKTFGCQGGAVGVGFGNEYKNFAGGEEGFFHFLSTGNGATEEGRRAAEKVKPFLRKEAYDNFVHGERYRKTPDLVRQFVKNLPMVDIPAKYVVFKPLSEVDRAKEAPETIIFFADPDQLSALVVLANYGRDESDSVIIPHAAACQTIGIYPYREARNGKGRAVVGLTDLSARVHMNRQLAPNLMTFAVPLAMFDEMEGNAEGSFLGRHTWQTLVEGKERLLA
jgi:uncharacterized protein (DUF169 family)